MDADDTQAGRMPRGDDGRDCSDVSKSQGTLNLTRNHEKLQERHGNRLSHCPQKESTPSAR